jgi:putative ABC transport system permease protein
MNHLVFFLNYAVNRLWHGGQRILIALLAVAFGVMSLITMASMADAIGRTMKNEPRTSLGGDLLISRGNNQFDLNALSMLETLQTAGEIDAYSPVSEWFTLLMRTEASGKARFISRGMGINPVVYPLVGSIEVAPNTAGTTSPAELLREKGTALITRDVAAQYNLKVGDQVRLAEADGSLLHQVLTIVGIATDTPTHDGQRLYYSLETTQALFGRSAVFDYAVIRTANPDAVGAQLEAAGWQVKPVPAPPPSVSFWSDVFTWTDLFDFMLRGAGVLGLLVGGIGIANTMQVMLAQRRKEIGILKTLGYSQRDMLLILLLEVGILALLGSLLGAAVAIVAGQALTQLFASITSLLVQWQFNPTLVVSGILIGIITTTLFAFYAILRTSRIRPSVIFRQEPSAEANKRQWLSALGFYALLAIPFAGVTSLIMGTAIEGVGILLVALGGLVGFTILLGVTTWILLRVMPTFRSNLLRIARNNMRKRMWSMLFAMIALFVGIFTVGFAMTIIQVSFDQFTARQDTSVSQNLLVYVDSTLAPSVEQALVDQGVTTVNRRYTARGLEMSIANQPIGTTLQARDTAWDIEIVEGAAFDSSEGVYVINYSSAAIGDELTIRLVDGTTRTLPIIGRYDYTVRSSLAANSEVPIVSRATMTALGIGQPQVTIYAIVDQAREAEIAQHIGELFPRSMTLTRADVTAEINKTFMSLLGFALAMAGLALLAGVMLIANVVSLAMIERRFEIGVMKAVGYTQQHIMALLALEYGLIGFIASVIGIAGVQVAIFLLAGLQNTARSLLIMNPVTALLILGFGMALTLTTALLSAWKPSHVRPLLILNEQAT